MARAQAISAEKNATQKDMVHSLAGSKTSDMWWMRLVLGIAAVLFGIASVFWPNLTMETLVYLLSAFVVVWGLLEFINGLLQLGKQRSAWLSLAFGVAALGTGIFLVRDPAVAFQTFILLTGFLLIVRGVFWVVETFLDRIVDMTNRTFTVAIGAAALTAGVILLFQPESSGVAFVWILGLFAMILGTVNIVMGLKHLSETQHQS